MTSVEACDVILSVIKAAWDPTGYSVNWPNSTSFVPPTDAPWIRCKIQHATGGQASLSGETGRRRFNLSGIVLVQVFFPVGAGTDSGYGLAKLVKDALCDYRGSDLWFRDQRQTEAGRDGAFEQINVSATFTYDEVR